MVFSINEVQEDKHDNNIVQKDVFHTEVGRSSPQKHKEGDAVNRMKMKTILRRKFETKIKNTKGKERKNEQYIQERKHTREYADFRGFQRQGLLNRERPKYMRSTNSSCNKPNQLRTTNGYGYTHL